MGQRGRGSMSRNYLQHTIDQLEALAKDPATDSDTLLAVKAELPHRKKTRQRADLILSHIDHRLASVPSESAKSETPRSIATESPSTDSAPDSGASAELQQLRREVQILRDGISVRSECLERWGLSISAPPALIDLAAEYWRRKLGTVADCRGRTIKTLEADLARERELRTSTTSES